MEHVFLHSARQRRPQYTRMWTDFTADSVPTEPLPEAITILQAKIKEESRLEQVKKVRLQNVTEAMHAHVLYI